MSLSNPNNVVTEERLSEFYQAILPYLGGMPDAICNKFNKSDLYDTTEKIVGKWTDGRPIYQKVVNCGSIASGDIGTQKKTNHGISNLREVINCQGIISKNGSWNCPLPFPNVENVNRQIAVNNISTTQIVMSVGSGVSASSWTDGIIYIILKYTKTTDAANSFKYADENDYSTTEKIVGTWINGKPVYQKTINFGVGPNATEKKVAHGISNIDKFIKVNAIGNSGGVGWEENVLWGTSAATSGVEYCYADGTNVAIYSNKNISTVTFYVTLQYTKTTD